MISVTLLINSDWCNAIKINNSYIYYSGFTNSAIYRINLDGTNKIKICDGNTSKIQFDGNALYFSDSKDERLYKVDILTSAKSKVLDQPILTFYVSGDWVYFKNDYFAYGIYKVKIDGSKLSCVRQDYLNLNDPILVANDFIYYINTIK